jgi:enterochelin esterase-like enzyme
MRNRVMILAGLACVFAAGSLPAFAAEAPAPAAPPRGMFGPPVISPELMPDRRVTFRLMAPNAKAVTVAGQWGGGPQAMTKDERGVWSVTLGPITPNLYEYSFSVDGVSMIDPGNSVVKPQRSPRTSLLEAPGSPPLLSEFQDVPHGAVRIHWYQSRSLGRRRGLYVYTPPGYDQDTRTRYPVLYLLHGAGDNEAAWTVSGRAPMILDNLLAQGKVVPFVVVMPDGHAAPWPPRDIGRGLSSNITDFERDLLEDVMPLVEKSYRVRTDAAHRAIAGLSMGGGQSLTIGLNHPELFGWIGGFSAAIFQPENSVSKALADPKATNQHLHLLWIACGTDDRLIANARQLSELLDQHQIKHQFVSTEGDHSWSVWRRYLAQFAPLLFTDRPSSTTALRPSRG